MKKQVPNAVRKAKKLANLTLAEQKKVEKLSTKEYKRNKQEQKEKSVYEDGMKEAGENGWF